MAGMAVVDEDERADGYRVALRQEMGGDSMGSALNRRDVLQFHFMFRHPAQLIPSIGWGSIHLHFMSFAYLYCRS